MLLDELRNELNKNGGFDGLRLSSAVFNTAKRILKLRFVTVEKLDADGQKAVAAAVEEIVKRKIRDGIKLQLTFDKDYMDGEIAKNLLVKYLEENFIMLLPLIVNTLEASDSDGSTELKFTVNNENFLLVKQMDVVNKCNNYFSSITNRKVAVSADVVRAAVDKEEIREWANQKLEVQITKAAFRPQRTINVEDVTEYIGRCIGERPKYIIDADREEKYVAVCGRVQGPREIVTASGYTLFKFDVADHTSSIGVVMFPSEDPAMMKKLKELKEGTEVLISGSVALNSYSGTMEFKAYRVSKCKINEPDYLALKTREVPKNYINVKEEDFVSPYQANIFSENIIPESLAGKSFVVFDFETTGTEFLRDKIIELGAVKIENGVITKKFSTFVNPEKDIPRNITELTGITNKDVEKAPVFEEIIADFYKFAYGSAIIAHNIDFDFGFLRFNTKNSGYIFSQRQIDTLSLARKFYALPVNRDKRPPDYKLPTLAAHMGIDCQNAHRALDDAKMTAEVFLRIMSVFDDK